MELSPSSIHLLPLVEPLILAELRVERPLLHPPHLHCEPRSKLLKPCLCLLLTILLVHVLPLLKDVPVMSHEYEVALIMERRHLPSLKLCVVGEQTSQESTSAMSQSGSEAVQIQLGYVRCGRPVVRHTSVEGMTFDTLKNAVGPPKPLAAVDGRKCDMSMPLHTLLFSDSTIRCVNLRLLPNVHISFTEYDLRG